MKASATMHLPKDDERERLPSLGVLDFDLDDFLGSISDPPVSLKKDSLECPECRRRGEKFHIRSYQLNFHEAMYLCPNPTCSYPMKEDRLLENFTFQREASLAVEDDKKELYCQSSDSFGDILDSYDESIFDNSMEFTSVRIEESRIKGLNNPAGNETRTSLLVGSDLTGTTAGTSTPAPHDEYPLSQPTAYQHPPFASIEMDTDDRSTTLNTGSLSHHVDEECASTVTTIPTDHSVAAPVSEEPSSMTGSEILSCDKPMNTVSEIPDEETSAQPIAMNPTMSCASSMIQWKNANNSCWLDSILQITVSSDNVRAALSDSKSEFFANNNVWVDLINVYDQSQVSLNRALASSHDTSVSTDSISVNLSNVRTKFLEEMQKFVKQLEYGKFQSLVEMLPLSVKVDGRLENIFKTKLLWHFQCRNCNHQSARRSDGFIVSMPNTLDNFHPLNAQFKQCCPACKSHNASTAVWMEQLPPCIVFHFQNGLSHSNLKVLDFALCGQLYCIFAMVQYVITGSAKHFITWIRDIKNDSWLRCDDLREPVCQWTKYQPKIPQHEIHMIFWERKHSAGSNTIESALQAICNEEVMNLAESIPVEHFQAHEKETIVLSEDASSSTTAYNNAPVSFNTTTPSVHSNSIPINSKINMVCSQNQVFDTSQTEVCARNACGVTADIESSTLMHASGQNAAMHTPAMHNEGQNGQDNASSQAGPALVTLPAAGLTHTTLQPAPQLENGTMMAVPTDPGRQHIQIIAPPNACNIYIVSQGGQMGQPYYLIPAAPKCNQSYPTLPSFINNPHSYNMVAQGVRGPLQNQTEKPKGLMKRIRRQYKLSGYRKRPGPASRYTPTQASKSCSSIKSADSVCDAASVKSCNSKGDSETRSEISELSDVLPDFEPSGAARDHI